MQLGLHATDYGRRCRRSNRYRAASALHSPHPKQNSSVPGLG